MIPLLGIANEGFDIGGRTAMYFVVTIAFLAASVMIVRRVWENELIILGLVTAAAAMGYSFVGHHMSVTISGGGGASASGVSANGDFAATLMKIAVVLVLAGVVRKLLAPPPGEPASITPKA